MPQIQITYQGTLRCTAQHTPSNRKLLTDAPLDNHGRGESFSPTDLVATALGTCALTIMGIVADRHAWDISTLQVHVQKHMTADPVRRIAKLVVEVRGDGSLDAEQRSALEKAALTCPVNESLGETMLREFQFNWG